MIKNKTVLITGGTGSFGNAFTEIALRQKPKKLIIFSRDEFKQSEMAKKFSPADYPIRYFLGDVRDKDRLIRAFNGVDYVIHAAALKQVPALEYNPMEAIKTNILGAENVINAAIECRVKKVIGISSDKAVNPINLYGATKLCAEKLFIAANAYSGQKVKFSVVRYGNVIGSRGSVIPYWQELYKQGIKEVPITDLEATRFWISLDDAVKFVLFALRKSKGTEIFVPKMETKKMMHIAQEVYKGKCKFKVTGLRNGEKLHELLISKEESYKTKISPDYFVIYPNSKNINLDGFQYSSDGGGIKFDSGKYDYGVSRKTLKAMDGDGIVRYMPCEKKERDWRADPIDGLRPRIYARKRIIAELKRKLKEGG